MTQSLGGSIETVSHQVDRLTIQLDDSFDRFRNSHDFTSLMRLAGDCRICDAT